MPALVAAAVAAVAPSTAAWGLTLTVGSTVIGTASFATLIGYAATIGGAIAYGQSQANKLKNMSKLTVDQGRSVMARDPLASRRLIYGQVLVTGPVVFMTTSGTKNEWLHMCVALAGHEVEEIGTIYFDNGEEVTLDGSGAATGKYAGKFFCTKHLGTADQLVDGSIQSNVPTEWTADHRLRGIAYLAMSFYYDTDLFPNGVPTVKAMVKGAKVYDPREAGHNSADPTTWTWSANSALCAAHYLNNSKFGRGIAWSRINTTGLISEANICDELVTLADASTEKRYQTNGTTNSDQDARGDLCAAMAGRIIETGGIWSIQAGAYRTPGAMTITDDMIVGAFNVQTRQSMRETFSGVKGTFIAPINEWMPADFPAVKNDTYMADDGGVRRWKDVSYPFITSAATAQRLSKIDLERGRQQIVVSTVLRLDAFKLACGDTVAVTRASLGWSAKLFEVIEWKFQVMDNNGLGVAVTLKETAEAVWDWANGEETTVDLAPNTTLPDPTVVPTPVLTLLTDSTTATIQPDGTVQPRLKASWTTPNNIYVENGGYVEIEFKKTTDTDYTVWSVIRGDALFDYILDVKVGVQYNVRVRFRNQAGVRGAYDTETSSAVVGDTTTPNGVGGTISATARAGFIDLQWTPSTSGTVNEYYIYRSIVSAVAGFALLAQTANSQYQDSNVSAGTTYWYYVVAQSASGINSPDSSVVSAAAIFAPNGVVPSSPTAPAQPGSPVVGTYDATDGSVFAFVTLDIAAMPSNAVWQNLLYRRTGSGDWMVAAQFKNTGSTTIRLDDLSPGVGYDIAMQAWNGAGGSAVVTGTSFTAASKTTVPATLSAITYTAGNDAAFNRPQIYLSSSGARFYMCRANWDPPANKDIIGYDVFTGTPGLSDAAATTAWNAFLDLPKFITETEYIAASLSLVNVSVYVRAVNSTGLKGLWYDGGGINTASKWGFAAGTAGGLNTGTASGTVATGDDTRFEETTAYRTAAMTIAPAAAANPRAMTALFAGSGTFSFVGTAPTETLDVDITDRGFTAKPDWGLIQLYDTNFLGVYDYDTSSSSTNARFVVFSRDGGNLGAGGRRFHFIVGKY